MAGRPKGLHDLREGRSDLRDTNRWPVEHRAIDGYQNRGGPRWSHAGLPPQIIQKGDLTRFRLFQRSGPGDGKFRISRQFSLDERRSAPPV